MRNILREIIKTYMHSSIWTRNVSLLIIFINKCQYFIR